MKLVEPTPFQQAVTATIDLRAQELARDKPRKVGARFDAKVTVEIQFLGETEVDQLVIEADCVVEGQIND